MAGLPEGLAMRRLALLLAVVPSAFARAEDPKPGAPAPVAAPAAAAIPPLATEDEARAGIEKFKAAFKNKDVGYRATAMFALAKVQHPLAVEELGKVLTNRNLELRTAAAMAFADFTAIPGVAGARLLSTFDANGDDAVYLMTAIDGVESVRYRAALPTLIKLFKHKNGAVVKHAIFAIARLQDVRALDALLEMMKEHKIEDGYSWQGGEVSVDTGAPGTADQEAAEAQYQQQYGNNGSKPKSAAKKVRDIGQILLLAMKDLTGQQFSKTSEARAWVEKNKARIEATQKALDEEQKAQAAAAAALTAKPK
jgi:HEAT repeat protein